MRSLQDKDVASNVTRRLLRVARSGNQLTATFDTDYSDHVDTRLYDQVVVNCGTLALAEPYFDLKDQISNGGAVDHDALIEGRVQRIKSNAKGRFQVFRIGDAVSALNTRAAI